MSGLNQSARMMSHIVAAMKLPRDNPETEVEIARVYLGQALRDLRDGDTSDAITMIEGALVRLGGKL